LSLSNSVTSVRRPILIGLLLILAWTSRFTVSDVQASDLNTIPSITAERVKRDTRSGVVLSTDWVQLSPQGLRVRQTGVGNSLEYLQNFTGEQLWLLDRARKILLEATPGNEVFETSEHDDDTRHYVASVTNKPQSSLLALEPCIDLNAKFVGKAEWRSQQVQVYECRYAGGELYSNVFYSEKWGLVVREERDDQTTDELINIKHAQFSKDHFIPPDYFNRTDFRELMIGAPELEKYLEE